MNSAKSSKILLLMGMVILSVLETDLYLASFPAIAAHFHTSESVTQISLNIYMFVIAIGVLFVGPLADRFGRKRIFLCALMIDLVGTLFALSGVSTFLFLLGRALQAVGGCAGSVMSRVIIKELLPKKRMIGYLFVSISLGIAFSPILGGIIQEWVGWQGNFIILALYQIALLIGIYRGIPETLEKPLDLNFKKFVIKLKDIGAQKEFVKYATLISLIWTGLYVFIGASSFFLIEQFQITPAKYGVLFALMIGGMVLGSAVYPHLMNFLGLRKALGAGMLFILAGGILLALCSGRMHFFCLAIGVYLFGLGILLPLSQDEATKNGGKLMGTMFSFFIFLQTLSVSILGFIFSVVASPSSMPYFVSFFAVVSFAFYISKFRRTEIVLE